jgi:chemotaxis-related protein WspB
MQALAFRAGHLRFALRNDAIVELLPRTELRPVALAPESVIGLLPFRGTLTPVVDLCRLVLGRDCAPRRSTRIVVVAVPARDGTRRLVGLQAEEVLDLIPADATVPGLRLPDRPWLGDHLTSESDLPQLLDPAALLPAELEALFEAQVPA